MTEDKSTADRFIEVMALIKSIEPEIEDPARHMMRRNRILAEQIIDAALRQAFDLAWQAKDISDEVAKILAAAEAAIPKR